MKFQLPGIRALARALERDVRRLHDVVAKWIQIGIVEQTGGGKLRVSFEEIHADFVMRAAA